MLLGQGRPRGRRRLAIALIAAAVPVVGGLGFAATALAGGGILPAWIQPISAPVSQGAVTHLKFIEYPDRYSTSPFSDIKVAAVDAAGNTVQGDTRSITISIENDSSPALSGYVAGFGCASTTVQAVDGIATFTGCAETVDGSHYRIDASATGLPDLAGPMFYVSGVPASVRFGWWVCTSFPCPQPGPVAGVAQSFLEQPVFRVVDAQGVSVLADDSSVISLAIASGTPSSGGPGALTCSGGPSMTVTTGSAFFSGCAIDTAGVGYALEATSGTLASATSPTFDVTAQGTPAMLAFTSSPPPSGGYDLGPISVAVEDAWGATVTTDNSTSVTLTYWDGGASTFSCAATPLTQTVSSGVATFSSCTETTPGTAYAVYANSFPFWVASPNFAVNAPGEHLAFTVYPPTPTTTDLGTGTITVALEDANDTPVTADARTVTLSTNQNDSSFGCSSGLSEAAVNGVATFTGCTQSTIANGYTITASATGLPDVTGSAFDVTSGPATQIHLWWMCPLPGCVSPVPAAGVGLPFIEQPAVQIEDAQGRTVTSDSSTQATLSLTAGPPATLSCTGGLTMTVAAGWANFSGCSIDTAGTGYELTATTALLGSYSRGPFDVTGPDTAARLTFLAPPPATTYAYLGTIKVAVEDLFGNVISGDTRTVDLQLLQIVGNNAQQVTLTCMGGTSQAAQSGIATFTGCTAPAPGQYVLEAVASVGGFYTPSDLFTVIAPPSGGGGGAAPIIPQIALAVSASPTSLTGSGSVTYTYTVTNPGSLTLSGVSVSDTTCTPAYVAGDTNKDTLLEPGETWTYSCTATLAATTTDAAKASGTNNGTTVSATASATVTVTPAPALTPVTLTDGIAAGVDRGTSGFGTASLVVLPNHYVTVLGRTSPNLAGSLVEIWVRSKTGDWHRLTSRLVASDGTVHYFARVNGWTAYWLKFAGDSTHAPAASHGRIATSRS